MRQWWTLPRQGFGAAMSGEGGRGEKAGSAALLDAAHARERSAAVSPQGAVVDRRPSIF